MQSSGGPVGVELREGGNRLASRIMVEVNTCIASLSNDIGFLCLQVSQNSTISIIPRLYFLFFLIFKVIFMFRFNWFISFFIF